MLKLKGKTTTVFAQMCLSELYFVFLQRYSLDMKLIKTRKQLSEIKLSCSEKTLHLEVQVILISICSDIRQEAFTIRQEAFTITTFASSLPKYHKDLYASIDKLRTETNQKLNRTR